MRFKFPMHRLLSAVGFAAFGTLMIAANLYSTGYPWNYRETPAPTNWHQDWTEEKTSPDSTWSEATPAPVVEPGYQTNPPANRSSGGGIYVMPIRGAQTPYTPSVIITPKPSIVPVPTEEVAETPMPTLALETEQPTADPTVDPQLVLDPLPDSDMLDEAPDPADELGMEDTSLEDESDWIEEGELSIDDDYVAMGDVGYFVQPEEVARPLLSYQPKTGDGDGTLIGIVLIVLGGASAFGFAWQIRNRRTK